MTLKEEHLCPPDIGYSSPKISPKGSRFCQSEAGGLDCGLPPDTPLRLLSDLSQFRFLPGVPLSKSPDNCSITRLLTYRLDHAKVSAQPCKTRVPIRSEPGDPTGLLINNVTDESVTLSSAPLRPAMTHNYEWDALPVATYQLDTQLLGESWILVNFGIAGPQVHQDTFEVRKGEHTFVELFLYNGSMTPTPTTAATATPTSTDNQQGKDTDGDGLYDLMK